MHKIDSAGATVANEFTEGNVALAVPATVVSSNWLNAVQNELATLAVACGAALKTSGTESGDQLLTAVMELIRRGGTASPVAITPANNQVAAADVTAFPTWLSTAILGIEFYYRLRRRTDTTQYIEAGRVYITWDTDAATWRVERKFSHDDAGLEFAVAATGNPNEYKLRYTTDNLAGASYASTLSITDIKMIRA